MIAPRELEDLLAPPRVTAHLPPVPGRIRVRDADFVVEEIPAYPPDEAAGARHVLFTLSKRGCTTEAAVAALLRHLSLPRAAVGVAGLKDRAAVTTQWMSVPASAAEGLDTFRHPDLQLGPARPHSQKLRRGHLRGNRFALTVRDLELEVEAALDRVRRKQDALRAAGGLPNLFAEQRLGEGLANVHAGLAVIAAGRPRRRDHFVLSAAQSALFNLVLTRRYRSAGLRRVLEGDLLRKRDTGGMFVCDDPVRDQTRLDAGELEITGPIFGSKMRSPAAGTSAFALEQGVLDDMGVDSAALRGLGRNAPGSRRALQVDVEISARPAPAAGALSAGLTLEFALPAGSYATQLWAELHSGGSQR